MFLGDFGGSGTSPYTSDIQLAVAASLTTQVQSIKPSFIVTNGDNFYEHGVTDENDPRFQETFENVYTDPSLQIKWYIVAGNHDYEGNVTGQIAYSHHSTRWYYPSPYYTVTHVIPGTNNVTVQFLFIDTIIYDDWLSTQSYKENEWIKSTLASSTADWLFVVGHYPVWSVGSNGPTETLVDYLAPLLVQYKVNAYFSGHDHSMQHLDDGSGVQYFLSGMAARCSHDKVNEKSVPAGSLKFFYPDKCDGKTVGGFNHVHLTATEMAVHYYDTTGTAIYKATAKNIRNNNNRRR